VCTKLKHQLFNWKRRSRRRKVEGFRAKQYLLSWFTWPLIDWFSREKLCPNDLRKLHNEHPNWHWAWAFTISQSRSLSKAIRRIHVKISFPTRSCSPICTFYT